MTPPGAVAVLLREVTYRYRGAELDAVRDVSLSIGAEEFVGVIGPNGGGKSTLLQLVLGLHEPQHGVIEVFGQAPPVARSRIGYVPQRASIDAGVPATVLDIVLMGRLTPTSWGPRFARRDVAAARASLARARVKDLEHRAWSTLSGGQRQRVLIARALVADVDLLLLDEPTAGVDTHREEELLELLGQLNAELPIVMVTHDLPLVAAHMDRALWVDRSVTARAASDVTVAGIERLVHGGGAGAHRHVPDRRARPVPSASPRRAPASRPVPGRCLPGRSGRDPSRRSGRRRAPC